MMKLKTFLVLPATALLLFLDFAIAQQPRKLVRIGFVAGTSSSSGTQNLEALRQGLRELGYIEGDNIHIEPRWAEGSAERFPGLIAELIKLKVDLVFVSSAAGALAAKNLRRISRLFLPRSPILSSTV
jgi:putative ABC transport system substrate-binding protein